MLKHAKKNFYKSIYAKKSIRFYTISYGFCFFKLISLPANRASLATSKYAFLTLIASRNRIRLLNCYFAVLRCLYSIIIILVANNSAIGIVAGGNACGIIFQPIKNTTIQKRLKTMITTDNFFC